MRVLVYDKKTGKALNTESPIVFKDESVSDIKNKIFATVGEINDIQYYPNFVAVEKKENVVYLTNVIEDIESSGDTFMLVGEYLKGESSDDTYAKYSKKYADLTEDDFLFIVRLLVLKNGARENEINFVQGYIEKIVAQKKVLAKRIAQEQQQLGPFFEAERTIDYAKFFGDKSTPTFRFTSLAIRIQGSNVQLGAKGRFIKLDNIFNVLELSDDIPLIAYNIPGSDNPTVKVFNDLQAPSKEIKSWFLNERKKVDQISYKKIKGLLIKKRFRNDEAFVTINLLENGLILAKVSFEEDVAPADLDATLKQLAEEIDIVVNVINRLQGVFVHSKRLQPTMSSGIGIESLSADFDTSVFIERRTFSSALYNQYISNYVFEIKDTISQDVLSFYYKKSGKQADDSDRKGHTVNIRDNLYKNNSSTVIIYDAENVDQLVAIARQVAIVAEYSKSAVKQTSSKMKEKSHIKSLRKQGVTILSTKCQKKRQPEVTLDKSPVLGSYAIEFQGKRYVCPKKDFPYPGFTNDNIVCCFANDQRERDVFLRNLRPTNFDITVQPSNFKVNVKDTNENDSLGTDSLGTDSLGNDSAHYDSVLIKVVSDYAKGFHEGNAMSRYYFLSNENNLVPLTSTVVVEKLTKDEKEGKVIWLDPVPLSRITSDPPKVKCNFQPIMDRAIKDRCSHHVKNKVFGYNLNSYPCCFDKERDPYVQRKKKTLDITKQHIMTSDKVLDYQRIGVLPNILNVVFNEMIKPPKNTKFYRIGVVQDNAALLGAVLSSVKNVVAEREVTNTNEFREMLGEYIKNEPHVFDKLNNGDLRQRFGTVNKFVEYLLKDQITVDFALDLLEIVTDTNIIILDIPYILSESTQTPDYDNIKLVCKHNVSKKNKSPSDPHIILLKRQNNFEVVITLTQDPKTEAREIAYVHKGNAVHAVPKGKGDIVSFLTDFYSASCVEENMFPETFKYDENLTLQSVLEMLKDTPHEVIAQIVNAFNKVEFVLTKKKLLIPIKECGISDYGEKIRLRDLLSRGDLAGLAQTLQLIDSVNTLLPDNQQIQVIGLLTKGDSDTVNAVFTNFGQMVPIKDSDIGEANGSIQLAPFKYYSDANDEILSTEKKENAQVAFAAMLKSLQKWVYTTKTRLAKNLSEENKKKIKQISRMTQKSRSSKVDDIANILRDTGVAAAFSSTFHKYSDLYILKHIAREIIDDNIENLFTNNIIVSGIFDPTEITKRDEESVLMNIDDIRKWFKLRQ
jgi:hypothetical protein